MRLGICYNAFDGLELLEASLRTVRPVAHYIVVVIQDVSNFGEQMSMRDNFYSKNIKNGLIDELVYAPTNPRLGGHTNELIKRNFGKAKCQAQGCTHFMTMDVDELYKTNELINVIKIIEAGNYDASACQMQTYWKTSKYALDPPEEYYVPLIYKMDDRVFSLSTKWPVLVDPTRRLTSSNVKIFIRDEIQMHHMSYVRHDMGMKLRNSSANANFKNRIPELVNYYNNWKPGQQAQLAGREPRFYDLRESNDFPELFDI
jgi:hypothetical protein